MAEPVVDVLEKTAEEPATTDRVDEKPEPGSQTIEPVETPAKNKGGSPSW